MSAQPQPAQPQPTPNPPANTALERAQKLVDSLWGDAKLGSEVRKKAKELFPDIKVPEEDPVAIAANERIAALEKKLQDRDEADAKRQKDDAEKASQRSLEDALEAARKKYSLTDEGFNKMVERMKEKQNYTDAESAAAWVASEMPKPSPSAGPSWAPQNLNLFGSKTADENFKLLHKDPESFFDQTVAEILNENRAA